MNLALLDDPDVANLPPVVSARPPSMDTMTPLREAAGLGPIADEPSLMLQAQSLVDAHPTSPVALTRLAQAAQSVGDSERACAAARAAVVAAGQAPTGVALHAAHAAALVLAAQEAPDAEAILDRDSLPGAAVIRASLAIEAGDNCKALAQLADSTGPLVRSMRGWLMLDDLPDKAVAELRAAARDGLRSPDVLVNLGYGLAALGATDKAIKATREATRLSPTDPNAAYNLTVYLHRRGRNDDALAEMDRIAGARPDDPELQLRRAWAHVHLAQDTAGGLRHLKEARDRLRFVVPVPTRADIEASVAFLAYRLGQKAAAATQTALWHELPLSGPSEGVVKMLASVLLDAGDAGDLRRLLRSAGHVLSPSQLLAHQSRLAGLEEDLDEAAILAERAVELDPGDADLLGYAVNLIGEQAGRYADAATMVDRATVDPDPKLANNIALTFALSGQPHRAAEVIARAGGADALPFHGATAALVDLAAGRIAAGTAGYEKAVRRLQDDGDHELALLVDWRHRLAMRQLGLDLRHEAIREPPGKGHHNSRVMLRRVHTRVVDAS